MASRSRPARPPYVGKPSVRMSMLRQRSASASSFIASQPPMFASGVLLGAHGHAVGVRDHLAHDVGDALVGIARLAHADEPSVLGEAAGVQEEGHVEAVTDCA